MPHVITANYRDRGNRDERWLVREASEPAVNAKPCKQLVATDVRFVNTSATPGFEYEEGFDCTVIAVAASVEVDSERVPENGVHLHHGWHRFEDANDAEVRTCRTLTLTEHGEIIATEPNCVLPEPVGV